MPAFSQDFYIRGEVKDESGKPLQNVTILQSRTGYIFRSGSVGTFGIASTQKIDTFSFSLDGYQKVQLVVNAENYVTINLKLLTVTATVIRRDKLASLIQNLEREEQKTWFTGDETYASIVENHFVSAKKFPATGMSLNVDRASYSNIRRFISLNTLVPPDAVRIEEMLNYFNLNYHEPEGQDIFHISTTLTSCPWKPGNQLFYINLSTKKINLDTLPPSNLVFLIDISGSMDMPNRLPLLKSAFRLLVNNLREKDSVAIVVYGGIVGVMLNTTSGCEKEKILKAIDELVPGGSTPGESGVTLAYSVAKNHFIKGGNNRVILATDGDFNVGLKTEEELDELISRHRESGIYLTCLGVGMGNYKDSKIQTLARKGNGNFSYIDNFKEAEKVLFTEFAGTLYAVADDVLLNVDFNPDYVKEYRLIGFDNKVEALRDSLSVIEGGEIGSGQSMIAAFEIVPTELSEKIIEGNYAAGNFSYLKLQYQLPELKDSICGNFNFTSPLIFIPFDKLDTSYRFSATVIMFGSLLRSSSFTKKVSWNELITFAENSSAKDSPVQKEFIGLIQQAKNIYSKGKKKKNAVTKR